MSKSPSPLRLLLRTAFLAAILTFTATFGLLVEGGATRQVTDRALSALLLTTLPLAAAFAVWGAGAQLHPLSAFGENRRRSLLVRFSTYLWGFPLLMAALAAVVLAWTRGIVDPRLPADLLATLPVAAMAAIAVLFAFLAAGQWFGRTGLVVLLLACLTLGQAELLAAIVLPSAHVRHLLGVGATLPFDPAWSMAALWAFAGVGFCAWLLRVPP